MIAKYTELWLFLEMFAYISLFSLYKRLHNITLYACRLAHLCYSCYSFHINVKQGVQRYEVVFMLQTLNTVWIQVTKGQ